MQLVNRHCPSHTSVKNILKTIAYPPAITEGKINMQILKKKKSKHPTQHTKRISNFKKYLTRTANTATFHTSSELQSTHDYHFVTAFPFTSIAVLHTKATPSHQ